MKTLWLGCSYSYGVYNVKDEPILTVPSLPERVSEKLGEQEDWKILAFSAQGILRYSQIIKSLEEVDKLKEFDNVILQLTLEPRFVTWHNNIERNFIGHDILPFINDDMRTYFSSRKMLDPNQYEASGKEIFTTNAYSQFHLFKDRFRKGKNQETFIDIVDEMVKSTFHFINCSDLVPKIFDTILEILEKRNLNIYTFYYYRKHTRGISDKYDIFNGDMLFNPKDYKPNIDYVQDTNHPMIPIMDRLTDNLVHALKDNGYE